MPSPMVGASDRTRISRAGCAGRDGLSGALTVFSGGAHVGRGADDRTRPEAATVACQARNAALAHGADSFPAVGRASPERPPFRESRICRVEREEALHA